MTYKHISFKPSLLIDENLCSKKLRSALDPFFYVTTVHQSNLLGASDTVLWDHVMNLASKPDFILTADKRYQGNEDLTYLMYDYFFECFKGASPNQTAQKIAEIPLFIYADPQKDIRSFDNVAANLVANQAYLMHLKQHKVSPVVFLQEHKISVDARHFKGGLNMNHFSQKNIILAHMSCVFNRNAKALKQINHKMSIEFNYAALYTQTYLTLMPLIHKNKGIHIEHILNQSLYFKPDQYFLSVS
jgi:hypothetical protein